MKPHLFTVPVIVLLASCSSKPAPRVVVVGPESSGKVMNRGEAATVRHPETIKAYPVGRYVEPRHKGVMHEAHTLYRVEQTPRWNLARPAGAVTTPALPLSRASTPSGSELTVELNRQRQATQAVMQSGQVVSDKLAEMTAALEGNRVLAEQNAAVREELHATRLRLEALEKEMRSRPASAPASSPPEEEPW